MSTMTQPFAIAIGVALLLALFRRMLNPRRVPVAAPAVRQHDADAFAPVQADLTMLLHGAVAQSTSHLRDDGIVWCVGLPAHPLKVAVHPPDIEELLRHLLALPCAGARPYGTFQVRAAAEGGHAVLHFMDHSGSAGTSHLAAVFDRGATDGVAGLVARCRQIVQRHAGRIYAAPSPLGSLGLTVRLPLRAE